MCTWWPVANKLFLSAWPPVACKKCMQLAASCIQIVPEWPPVTCKLYPSGRQLHANSRNCIHVACDWGPLWHNLHATGGHSGTIYMRWPPVAFKIFMRQRPVACKAASCLQACCQNNYLNKEVKTPLKNFRIYATYVLARTYPSTPCMARSNLMRQFL